LRTYAEPRIGKLPVQSVDTSLVMNVLEPIWSPKAETAGRLRGRIEAILDWATVRGFRAGDNPARWRGHLDKLLPATVEGAQGAASRGASPHFSQPPVFFFDFHPR
jgi:hypothetical protein